MVETVVVSFYYLNVYRAATGENIAHSGCGPPLIQTRCLVQCVGTSYCIALDCED